MEREKNEMNMGKHAISFMYILMGALFLPVLFCLIFIGNHMDYNAEYKVNALLPNYIFAMIALAGFVFIFLVAWPCRKIRLTHKAGLGLDGLLAVLFLLLFLVNVRKLTNGLIPTLTAFLLYLALAGITPWKIAPYTDVYGIAFPIACIYFYLCYRDTEKTVRKYLSMAAALMAGMLGGLVKPSRYIVVIAILVAELVSWLVGDRKRWHYILAEIGLVAVLLLAKGACMDYMMKDMGLDFNPEIEAGWHNYFHMGQNGETTGTYSSDDESIFGEFQDSRDERDKAAFERAVERINERGLLGNICFWLKKMVMFFNDGTFGWQNNWIYEHYPPDLASNNECMELLRNIFWPESLYSGRFNAFCQLAWIFCMLGIAGICFCPKEQREKHVILVVAFLGIFCYQLLFEAKPRYLLVFLPLLCVVSVCGMWQWVCRIHDWICKWSFSRNGQKDKAGNRFLERGTRQ